MSETDEVLNEFLVESSELLDRAEQDLMQLEKGTANKESLASIFRSVHTIKGTAGFFSFSKLQGLTHAGENVLGRLRDGHLTPTPHIVTTLLQVADSSRKMLQAIEAHGTDGDNDYAELVAVLAAILAGQASAPVAAPVLAPPAAVLAPPAAVAAPQAPAGAAPVASVAAVPSSVRVEPRPPSHHPTAAKAEAAEPADAGSKDALALSASNNSIRVDVGQLEKLMNLVGELVLTRNQILQLMSNKEDAIFTTVSQRLNLITTELQEGVMKARMQPIDNVWSKFPRVVRDLAMETGKRVRIEMEGRDTELDRTIIEAIKDPLTHIVRNAIDHGIERPELRRATGKSEEARLFLRAYHEGGQVNIEISDDGGGIDVERVRLKAIDRGLISVESSAHMTEREIIAYIFQPGFSTANKVTNVSGRGVGMDVVKTNIEKIGGTVDIQSRQGLGTTLKIKIPLTLAIIPALIITTGGDRFAIPQVSLLELVRLEADNAKRAIEIIHGTPVYRLRGNLLPLVYLNATMGVESRPCEDEATSIVVLQADDRQFGLVVDDVNDTEEIVVKPLGKLLKGITVFAGATIMGDGRVALILDVLGLAQKARVVSEVQERAMKEKNLHGQAAQDERQTLLLLGAPDDGRLAVPLEMVSRLEEIQVSTIERVGSGEVVQYRGDILPLTRLTSLLSERRKRARAPKRVVDEVDKLHVVVVSRQGRTIGLVVERILDIVEEHVVLHTIGPRRGVQGSAVIQGRVTELLDIDGLLALEDDARLGGVA